jgi:hypothetical protein
MYPAKTRNRPLLLWETLVPGSFGTMIVRETVAASVELHVLPVRQIPKMRALKRLVVFFQRS